MHVDLLVGPMVLGTYGEMFVVLALTEYRFDVALAAVGQKDVFGGPLVPVGDHDPLTEDLRVQTQSCVLVDPIIQAIGSLALRVILDVEHFAEELAFE